MRAEHSDVSAAAAGYPPHNCGGCDYSLPSTLTPLTTGVMVVSVPSEYDYGHQTVTLMRPWPESFALLLLLLSATTS